MVAAASCHRGTHVACVAATGLVGAVAQLASCPLQLDASTSSRFSRTRHGGGSRQDTSSRNRNRSTSMYMYRALALPIILAFSTN